METKVPPTVEHHTSVRRQQQGESRHDHIEVVAGKQVEINRVIRQRMMGKEQHLLLNMVNTVTPEGTLRFY